MTLNRHGAVTEDRSTRGTIGGERLEDLVTTIYAHRGNTLQAGQNTLDAFAAAVALGCDGIELDVRRTRDGAIVCVHDPEIDGLGAISDLTVAELPSSVPLLAQALEVAAPLVVNVELKNDPGEAGYDPTDAFAAQVIAVVEHAGAQDRVIYSSFDRGTLDQLVALGASSPVGWLLGLNVELDTIIPAAVEAGFAALHPFLWSVTEESLVAAHGAGLAVNTWTVNGEEDMERLVRQGVDCIITDRPDLGLAILERFVE